MLAAFSLVLCTLAAGYLARRLGRFPESAPDVLNRFVIDVCVPAAILRLIPTLSLRWDLLALVVTPWMLAVVGAVVARVLAGLLELDRASASALFLCMALGNTSFLGFPLCSALLGEQSVSLAAVYDQLGSFLLISTVAPVVIARAVGGKAPSPSEIARRVIAFPPFLALVVAVLPLRHPAWLDAMLASISAALVPVAMFAVGLRVRITPPKQKAAFALGLFYKLGLAPLIAYGFVHALNTSADVRAVAVLESAMPPMITAGALVMAAGLAPELAAALVGWGILVSLISVPAWSLLFR